MYKGTICYRASTNFPLIIENENVIEAEYFKVLKVYDSAKRENSTPFNIIKEPRNNLLTIPIKLNKMYSQFEIIL